VNIDIPHMIVTFLLLLIVTWGVARTAKYREATKGKRILMMAIPIFVVLLILNLVWPIQ